MARLMRVHGIHSDCRRRPRPRGSTAPPDVIAANALQRAFTATSPNQKWAGDITFVRTRAGWLYVAVLLDLYSRRVVGWAMSAKPDQHVVARALTMALTHRRPAPGLLHHTDQGAQ